jgi:hypothetical protein
LAERVSGVWRFALVDARSSARRAIFSPNDSTIEDYTALPGGGWAWIASAGRAIVIQTAGAAVPRRIPIPEWYSRGFELDASPDGGNVVLVGWSAPTADSIGVSVLSLADGKETHWATVFGEGASAQWLNDGSMAFAVSVTPETFALQRLRGPGQSENLGIIPRAVSQLGISRDLKRMSVVSREQHGDAWIMRVVKR